MREILRSDRITALAPGTRHWGLRGRLAGGLWPFLGSPRILSRLLRGPLSLRQHGQRPAPGRGRQSGEVRHCHTSHTIHIPSDLWHVSPRSTCQGSATGFAIAVTALTRPLIGRFEACLEHGSASRALKQSTVYGPCTCRRSTASEQYAVRSPCHAMPCHAMPCGLHHEWGCIGCMEPS